MSIGRYILFTGIAGDGRGGWGHAFLHSDKLDQVREHALSWCATKGHSAWAHIVDTEMASDSVGIIEAFKGPLLH